MCEYRCRKKMRGSLYGGIGLSWSYKKLWILLLDRKMKKTDLLKVAGINSNALARMGKDQTVTMDALAKICKALDCGIQDIVEYIPDED